MKTTDIIALINSHRSDIISVMESAYRDFVETNGAVCTQVYIYDDGEITTSMVTYGSSEHLQARNPEIRGLFYIRTVGGVGFDWRDFADRPLPEKPYAEDFDSAEKFRSALESYEAELDDRRTEVIDWFVSDYDADSELDRAIDRIAYRERGFRP